MYRTSKRDKKQTQTKLCLRDGCVAVACAKLVSDRIADLYSCSFVMYMYALADRDCLQVCFQT